MKFTFIRNVIHVYWILFCVFMPVLICMAPTIIYLITYNTNYLWLLFLSMPIGTAVAIKTWDWDFMSKYAAGKYEDAETTSLELLQILEEIRRDAMDGTKNEKSKNE